MKNLFVVVILLAWFAAPARADFDTGMAAYYRGDYATALKEFRSLAEKGDAVAQHNLGVMYDEGKGVPQDYAEAVKWWRQAADQGHASSQNNLGVYYYEGKGIPQDYVQAHMWFNLSGSQGNKEARDYRDIVERRMTPAQIAIAQKLARGWKPKK